MSERFRGYNPSEELPHSIDEEYNRQLKEKTKKLGRFKLSQIVNVQRSSGEMEGEWIITGYNEETDRVIVMQDGPVDASATTIKAVKLEDLERWNPE